MSARLVDEVLRHAPQGLTFAERLILLVIADAVNGKAYERAIEAGRPPSRSIQLSHDYLSARCGMDVRTFREYLRRLALTNSRRAGIEVRVAIKKGADGRKLYAVDGVTPRFVVPVLQPPRGCDCRECQPSEGAPDPPVERALSTVPRGA